MKLSDGSGAGSGGGGTPWAAWGAALLGALLILGLALILALGWGCNSPRQRNGAAAADFFPLGKNFTWTYQVKSKSQRANYVVVDRVRGEEYVPALKMTGEVVDEFYTLARAGLRPLLYYHTSDGYLSRLSGLAYSGNRIVAPPWGRSIEDRFLPAHLEAGRDWDNRLLPYGQMAGSPRILQRYRAFAEPKEVAVPAGAFTGCVRVESVASFQGGQTTGQNMQLYYLDWYAPNVGLIKSLALEEGRQGAEMERVELVSYDLSGKAKH